MSHIGNDMFMENAYLDGLEEGEKLGLSGEELKKFADKYAKDKFEKYTIIRKKYRLKRKKKHAIMYRSKPSTCARPEEPEKTHVTTSLGFMAVSF